MAGEMEQVCILNACVVLLRVFASGLLVEYVWVNSQRAPVKTIVESKAVAMLARFALSSQVNILKTVRLGRHHIAHWHGLSVGMPAVRGDSGSCSRNSLRIEMVCRLS